MESGQTYCQVPEGRGSFLTRPLGVKPDTNPKRLRFGNQKIATTNPMPPH